MAVEGIGISATARIKQCAPNTVSKWRKLAATYADRFNNKILRDFELIELQADEICTFVKSKANVVWIMTLLEVSARLWISCVIGRRTFENVKIVIGTFVHGCFCSLAANKVAPKDSVAATSNICLRQHQHRGIHAPCTKSQFSH